MRLPTPQHLLWGIYSRCWGRGKWALWSDMWFPGMLALSRVSARSCVSPPSLHRDLCAEKPSLEIALWKLLAETRLRAKVRGPGVFVSLPRHLSHCGNLQHSNRQPRPPAAAQRWEEPCAGSKASLDPEKRLGTLEPWGFWESEL